MNTVTADVRFTAHGAAGRRVHMVWREWRSTMGIVITLLADGAPLDIVEEFELTVTEREQFDYLNWAAIDAGSDSASFFRDPRDGELQDLGQFMRYGDVLGVQHRDDAQVVMWDGLRSDSFSDGLAVRYVENDDGDGAVVACHFYLKGN